VHQREGEVEAPPHSSRIGAHTAVGGVFQIDPAKQHVGPSPAVGTFHPVQHTLQPQELAAGHVRVDGRVLQRHADTTPHDAGLLHHVVPSHDCGTRRGPQQRGEHAHHGAFARTVGAQKAKDAARFDGKGNSVNRFDAALVLPDEVPCLNCLIAHVYEGSRTVTPTSSPLVVAMVF
jgi:hypothetical protein